MNLSILQCGGQVLESNGCATSKFMSILQYSQENNVLRFIINQVALREVSLEEAVMPV